MNTRARLKSRILSLCLVALATTITACTPEVKMLPTLTPEAKVTNQQGLLVARVINASSYPLPFNQLTVTPDNVQSSKKIKPFRLLNQNSKNNGTTVFAAPIQEGTYALSSIRSFYTRGDYWYSKFVPADAKFGTFSVKAGKTTDLGTLIYYPNPDGDVYKDMLIRLPQFALQPGEVLDKHFPFYSYDADKVLTWHEDDLDEQRNAQYNYIATNPLTFGEQYKGKDGNIYLLGKLGAILKYNSVDEFELDGVDSNMALVAFAQSDEFNLVVADAEGKLFVKNEGQDWQPLNYAKNRNIHHLQFYKDKLDVISSVDAILYVERFDFDSMQWSQLNQYTWMKGWSNYKASNKELKDANLHSTRRKLASKTRPHRITDVELSVVNGRYQVAISHQHMKTSLIFKNEKTDIFLTSPESWQVTRDDASVSITKMVNAGAVNLGIKKAGFFSLSSAPTFFIRESDDLQWHELNTKAYDCINGTLTKEFRCRVRLKNKANKYVIRKPDWSKFSLSSVPVFTDGNTAIALAKFSNTKLNIDDAKKLQIVLTTDAGQHWTITGNQLPNDYCGTIVPQVTDRILLSCSGASSDFYESFDQGKTWSHVRQQDNL